MNLRQLAYLIDTLIFWAILYGATVGLYGSVSALYAWTVMISLRGLFAIKDGLGGRSPGKLVCGLQVVGAWDREPIGPWKSFKRNVLLTIPPLNVLSIAMGILTMEQGQRLADPWARTKVIWRRYRWRTPFTPDDQHCGICGYDLTGNVSGRCPECGRVVPRPPAPEVYCPQCGYDVSDHVGGWCPACGREIARVPVLTETTEAPPPDRFTGEPA